MALHPGDVYRLKEENGVKHFYVVVSALKFNNVYATVVIASSASIDEQMEYDQTVVLDETDHPEFGAGTVVHPETIRTVAIEKFGPPRLRVASVRGRMAEIIRGIGKVIGSTCSEDPWIPPGPELHFP